MSGANRRFAFARIRFLDQVLALTKAFALAGARDEALALRDDVKFFADMG